MEELKQGHKKNFYKSHDRIEDLLTAMGKIDFKGTTAPALRNGVGQLKANTKKGDESTTGLVKPDEIKQSFKDATKFNAELVQYFPSEAYQIDLIKRELKQHHFDLSGLIKDVDVHATSTKDNVDRARRKLFLRKKYAGTSKWSPKADLRVW
jgi:hypothetical protein